MNLSLIAACSRNKVLGFKGEIPWQTPTDLKFFKLITQNKILIMGRKTLESLPFLLKGRLHIVVTQNKEQFLKGEWYQGQLAKGHLELLNKYLRLVTSVADALNISRESIATDNWPSEIMVVGGGQIYKEMIDLVDLIYLTQIDMECQGDAYFPEVDFTKWEVTESISYKEAGLKMNFQLIEKKQASSQNQDFYAALKTLGVYRPAIE